MSETKKVPKGKTILSHPLIGAPTVQELAGIFETRYRDRLEPITDGSGRGRDGEKDGWIYGLSNYRIMANEIYLLHPLFRDAIRQIAEPEQDIAQVMFNRMAPGSRLERHVDGPPYRDRYHLPLITSGSTYWQDYTHGMESHIGMRAGVWYGPISYWLPHSVTVSELGERVLLLVDLEPRA